MPTLSHEARASRWDVLIPLGMMSEIAARKAAAMIQVMVGRTALAVRAPAKPTAARRRGRK